MIDEHTVMNVLKNVRDPELTKDLVQLGMIRNLIIDEGECQTHSCPNYFTLSIKETNG
jgi:metal-sulfur cluster biosynthetic enzyme